PTRAERPAPARPAPSRQSPAALPDVAERRDVPQLEASPIPAATRAEADARRATATPPAAPAAAPSPPPPPAPASANATVAAPPPAQLERFRTTESVMLKSIAPQQPIVVSAPGATIRWRIAPGGNVERSTDGVTWQEQSTGASATLTAGAATSSTIC